MASRRWWCVYGGAGTLLLVFAGAGCGGGAQSLVVPGDAAAGQSRADASDGAGADASIAEDAGAAVDAADATGSPGTTDGSTCPAAAGPADLCAQLPRGTVSAC